MEVDKKDWTIVQLYEKSWEVIKKNKILWIFGAASAGIGASFQSGSNLNFDSESLKPFQELFNRSPAPQSAPDQLSTAIQQIFASVPFYFYLILAGEIILLVVGGIIISLIYQAWVNAALIRSVQTTLNGSEPTIEESSRQAFPAIKPLIWLQVVPSLIFYGVLSLGMILLSLGLVLGNTPLKILFALLLVGFIGVAVYAGIMLALSQIWAARKVVLDHASGKAALTSGYKIARKKKGAMMLLGLVNLILSALVVGIPLMVLAGILLTTALTLPQNFSSPVVIVLSLAAILSLLFFFGLSLLSGIINAFKATVWTIAYNNIRGKYDGS